MLIKILHYCLTQQDLDALLEKFKAHSLVRPLKRWLQSNQVCVPDHAKEVGLLNLGTALKLAKKHTHPPTDLLLRDFRDPRPLAAALRANKALLRRLTEAGGSIDLAGSLHGACDHDDARVWIHHLFSERPLSTGHCGNGRAMRSDGTVNGELLRAYLLEDFGIDLGVQGKVSEPVIDVSPPAPARAPLTVVQGGNVGVTVTHRAYVTPEEAGVLVEVAQGRLKKGVGTRLGMLAPILKRELGILSVTGNTKAAETRIVEAKARAILFVACPDGERRSPRRAAPLRKGMSVPPERWLEDLKRIATAAVPATAEPPVKPAADTPEPAKPSSALTRDAVERKLVAAKDELADKEAEAKALRERIGNLEYLLANFDKLTADD
ncbi:hypothetical protein EPO34_02205 [Patescibacteria group bacterium]|nr:MAG: hypothetical protein EPO34_02205 [Patescibacteria group bacterium]